MSVIWAFVLLLSGCRKLLGVMAKMPGTPPEIHAPIGACTYGLWHEDIEVDILIKGRKGTVSSILGVEFFNCLTSDNP